MPTLLIKKNIPDYLSYLNVYHSKNGTGEKINNFSYVAKMNW